MQLVDMEARKRNDLTLKQKMEILNRYDRLPKMSQRNAAAQLNISQPLLCKILKNRDELTRRDKQNENTECKRNRAGKDEQVEKALRLWFENVRERDAPVNGPLMQQKAESLAAEMGKKDFVATNGWFQRWKTRENIVYKKIHGEQKDADKPAAENWLRDEWPKLIASYSPENVYNADETGLYFRALPEHTYLFKNESLKGHKVSKERVTVLCCVSMSGEKQRLLVIGKSKNPRCFKGVKKLPVDYYANKNAWMTAVIFNDWIRKWDDKLKQDILLLVDNCTAHVLNVTLKHINVVFLPANTTSLLQPCDQGIIRALKAYYRHEMRARLLDEIDNTQNLTANDLAKKTNVLDAVHLLTASWNRVSAQTIRNCFAYAGSCVKNDQKSQEMIENPSDLTPEEFESWVEVDKNIPVASTLTESEICQIVIGKQTNDGTDESDEESLDIEPPPTSAEMRNALKVLKRGVQHRSDDFKKHYDYEQFINELLRKNCRQSTIDQFF